MGFLERDPVSFRFSTTSWWVAYISTLDFVFSGGTCCLPTDCRQSVVIRSIYFGQLLESSAFSFVRIITDWRGRNRNESNRSNAGENEGSVDAIGRMMAVIAMTFLFWGNMSHIRFDLLTLSIPIYLELILRKYSYCLMFFQNFFFFDFWGWRTN